MKYIRGQDGCIYSVSKLTPPCEEHPEGEAVWKLRVVTATGSIHVYATYRTEVNAHLAYTSLWGFMDSNDNMLTLNLGIDGLPNWMVEKEERVLMPDTRMEFQVPSAPRPWLEIPASALTPWWRCLWPRSRKEKANDE